MSTVSAVAVTTAPSRESVVRESMVDPSVERSVTAARAQGRRRPSRAPAGGDGGAGTGLGPGLRPVDLDGTWSRSPRSRYPGSSRPRLAEGRDLRLRVSAGLRP